jgi:uncharacterized membrane protein YjjP (DUF1212 family)
MDYNVLLDLVTKMGYRLAMSGAETFRIEESVNRIVAAYGLKSETFAIPNNLTISLKTHEGQSMTRMRRIGQHGNDLDAVERYSNLSRRICAEKPDPKEALSWLEETDRSRVYHSFPVKLLGHFLGAFGFAIFFGGGLSEAICGGLCGILLGLISHFTDKWHINQFFTTTVSSFAMAILAFRFGAIITNMNAAPAIVGTLMILVPGLLFTNAMRDIIFGDTNSGINRIVQVLIIAVAIALGVGAASLLSSKLLDLPTPDSLPDNSIWLQLLGSLIGCIGFTIFYNIHFPGGIFCVIGGVLTWGVCYLATELGCTLAIASFVAAIFAAVYSEIMARIRKYPAISYLVVSCFPLLPGAGVYFTTYFAVKDDMSAFVTQGKDTIAIAGALAVGILLVSTLFRFFSMLKKK